MKFILAIILGVVGFILGEGVSAMIRRDESGREDNSGLTWFLKGVFAIGLMSLVYSC